MQSGHQRLLVFFIAVGLPWISPSVARGASIVPGFTVTTYASVSTPERLSFDPSGVLYVGNGDNSRDGVRISRIDVGGGAATPFGPAIFDPDAVLVDAAGAISGVPGAVLVGGNSSTPSQGLITVIRPDQTSFNLFGPSPDFRNPSDMAFDRAGRLLFTDSGDGDATKRGVFVSGGANPSLLFLEPGGAVPDSLAVSDSNLIFTSSSDGVIRVHDAFGNLVDDAFASGLGGGAIIEFGRGAGFGTNLYALDGVAGTLLRFDGSGSATVVGTGFTQDVSDIAFGPDGALYVALRSEDLILRIASVPEPPALISGALGVAVMTVYGRRKKWGRSLLE